MDRRQNGNEVQRIEILLGLLIKVDFIVNITDYDL